MSTTLQLVKDEVHATGTPSRRADRHHPAHLGHDAPRCRSQRNHRADPLDQYRNWWRDHGARWLDRLPSVPPSCVVAPQQKRSTVSICQEAFLGTSQEAAVLNYGILAFGILMVVVGIIILAFSFAFLP